MEMAMKTAPAAIVSDQEYDRTSPPREQQTVEFLVVGRDVPLLGWYESCTFHSRWAKYSCDRVDRWRPHSERTDFV